jgi:hypothetical protein
VAPQTPVFEYGSFGLKRQGPMEQFLQQADFSPMGQADISVDRSKQVLTPSLFAFSSI